MITVLDTAGRIVLPGFVQAQLGIKPGDEVALEREEGKWVLKPVAAATPAAIEQEDVNWADLDYDPVPLPRVGQVAIQIKPGGNLKPMAHDLDQE